MLVRMKKLSAFRFRNARFFMVLYSNHPNHLSFHSHFVTVFFQWYYMQSIVLIKNVLSSEALTFGHKCFQNGLKQSLHDCEFSIGVEGGGSGLVPSSPTPFFLDFLPIRPYSGTPMVLFSGYLLGSAIASDIPIEL